jgi:hypothetical protein
MWLIEANAFQLPQLHKHFNVARIRRKIKHMTRQILLFSIIFLAPILSSVGQSTYQKETLHIPKGKVGLIGYGSLMSIQSMQQSLGHEYNNKPLNVHIKGYERVWNCAEPNNGAVRPNVSYFIMKGDTIFPKHIIWLNVQPNKNKSMNACLYIIDSAELKMFDKREIAYDRISVKTNLSEFKIVNGDVYMYIAKPECTIKPSDDTRENIIYRDYIKTVEEDALLPLGETFRNEYYATTIPFSVKILMSKNLKVIRKER